MVALLLIIVYLHVLLLLLLLFVLVGVGSWKIPTPGLMYVHDKVSTNKWREW